MSDRERWIIYPLLFLALGAALRDKFVEPTVRKSIVCQELTVVDDDVPGQEGARILAKIGPNSEAAGSGVVLVNGALEVTGVLNANQYAIQGHLLTPTFQAMFEFFRWLQAAQQQQHGVVRGVRPVNPPTATPPAVKSNDDTSGTPAEPKSAEGPAKEN
ncbi:MAG TPA: hypothetical protein VH107_02695 [Lacipirellulaceae bacterium]|jgi:hypothetical protein|nr:hypothetical protein [Lacipirellulaceae bacterium]